MDSPKTTSQEIIHPRRFVEKIKKLLRRQKEGETNWEIVGLTDDFMRHLRWAQYQECHEILTLFNGLAHENILKSFLQLFSGEECLQIAKCYFYMGSDDKAAELLSRCCADFPEKKQMRKQSLLRRRQEFNALVFKTFVQYNVALNDPKRKTSFMSHYQLLLESWNSQIGFPKFLLEWIQKLGTLIGDPRSFILIENDRKKEVLCVLKELLKGAKPFIVLKKYYQFKGTFYLCSAIWTRSMIEYFENNRQTLPVLTQFQIIQLTLDNSSSSILQIRENAEIVSIFNQQWEKIRPYVRGYSLKLRKTVEQPEKYELSSQFLEIRSFSKHHDSSHQGTNIIQSATSRKENQIISVSSESVQQIQGNSLKAHIVGGSNSLRCILHCLANMKPLERAISRALSSSIIVKELNLLFESVREGKAFETQPISEQLQRLVYCYGGRNVKKPHLVLESIITMLSSVENVPEEREQNWNHFKKYHNGQSKHSNLKNHIFSTGVKLSLLCGHCFTPHFRMETLPILYLDMPCCNDQVLSLEQCLLFYMEGKEEGKMSRQVCSECRLRRLRIKKREIHHPKQVLVMVIRDKKGEIDFPHQFELNFQCWDDGLWREGKLHYTLEAFVSCIDSKSQEYISYCRDVGGWKCLKKQRIFEVSDINHQLKEAYSLFYQLIKEE